MQTVIVSTFITDQEADKATQALYRVGASPEEVCELVRKKAATDPSDAGLVAVKVGSGHLDGERAESILWAHQGHPVNRFSQSPAAMVLIHGLFRAADPFQSPESVLPPVLLTAMEEQTKTQEQPTIPELNHQPSSTVFDRGRSWDL